MTQGESDSKNFSRCFFGALIGGQTVLLLVVVTSNTLIPDEFWQTLSVPNQPLLFALSNLLMVLSNVLVAGFALFFCWKRSTTSGSPTSLAKTSFATPQLGIPDRHHFLHFLMKEFPAETGTETTHLLLVLVDLDQFGQINRIHGHQIGDRLLRKTAERLNRLLDQRNEPSWLHHLGGDQFLLTLFHAPEEPPTEIAEKVMHTVTRPVRFGKRRFYLSASIGVVAAQVPTNEPLQGERLLNQAEAALQDAKKAGGGCYAFYGATQQSLEMRAQRDFLIVSRLRNAVKYNELRLVYQPQVAIATRTIIGAEALIRWHIPSLGMISPSLFIPIAERSALIEELGEWAIKQACEDLSTWLQSIPTPLTLSVNLSPRQLLNPNLLSKLDQILHRTTIPPDALKLEITESTLIEEYEAIDQLLHAIRQMGIHLAIDDFGAGFASFQYLKRLPVDSLKIDQSLIRNILTNPKDQAIVSSILTLTNQLGIEVIAEGVENSDQVAWLKANGCRFVQGYYFGKPLDAEQFLSLCLKTLKS